MEARIERPCLGELLSVGREDRGMAGEGYIARRQQRLGDVEHGIVQPGRRRVEIAVIGQDAGRADVAFGLRKERFRLCQG